MLKEEDILTCDCIIFQGAKDKDGYGWQRKNGERKAHRAAYVEEYGPIPEGMWILHSCDNPSCVNPKHLFLGTAKDNSDDMRSKGRAFYPGCGGQSGESNHNCKLSDIDVKYIRENWVWGSGPQLAKKFNVHVTTINKIRRGATR